MSRRTAPRGVPALLRCQRRSSERGRRRSEGIHQPEPGGIAAASAGLNPIGIAVANKNSVAITANEKHPKRDGARPRRPGVAGGPTMPVVAGLTAVPAMGSDAEKILKGKRFLQTPATGRWSLRGQGWGALPVVSHRRLERQT